MTVELTFPEVALGEGTFHHHLREVSEAVKGARKKPDVGAVLKKSIRVVFGCGVGEEEDVKGDVHADNPDETQRQVEVYGCIAVTMGISKKKIKVTPVFGTDVDDGLAARSGFYDKKTAGGVTFRDVTAFLFDFFASEGSLSPLTDLLTQLWEASFNCVTRHKQVFEHLVVTHLYATTPTPLPPLRFDIFMDKFKTRSLEAAIIHPMLYTYKNTYSIYENIEAHGQSMWGSIITQCLGVHMPYADVPELDSGWTWAAQLIEDAGIINDSMKGLGMPFHRVEYSAKSPPEYARRRPMEIASMHRSLKRVIHAINEGSIEGEAFQEVVTPLARFSSLFTTTSICKLYADWLLSSGYSEVGCVRDLVHLDPTDPCRVIYDYEGIERHIKTDCKVDLRRTVKVRVGSGGKKQKGISCWPLF